jgi:BASS family bile acid:Na+ symporter
MRAISAPVLIGLIAANLIWPGPGAALKDLRLLQLPLLGWGLDISTLALAAMMLSASVQCRPESIRLLIRNRRAGSWSLGLMYLVAPLMALLAGGLALTAFSGRDAQELRMGLFFVSLMPVAMTSAVWCRMAGGNLALSLALISLTTGLSVVTVPLYARFLAPLAGAHHLSLEGLFRQLVLSVALPLAIGMGLRWRFPGWVARWKWVLGRAGDLGLILALSSNVAGAAPHLRTEGSLVAAVAATVGLNLGLFGAGLLAVRRLRGERPGLSHDDAVALLLGGTMRSTGTAMVLAAASFPAMPLVTLPAAIYSVTQQLLAGYLVRALRSRNPILLPAVGSSRQELEVHVAGLLSRRGNGPVAVAVLRLDGAAAPWAALHARLQVRPYDYVAVVARDRVAIALQGLGEQQAARVARRVAAHLRAAAPHGTVRLGWALAPERGIARELVDRASSRCVSEERAWPLIGSA